MNLLITGASGFVGKNTLLRLPNNWSVTAVYYQSSNFEDWLGRAGLQNVVAARCDLADPSAVRELVSKTGRHFDACLYLAANGDPAASSVRVAWDLQSNTLALVNFLENYHVGHLVYVSSGAVYDGHIGSVSPSIDVRPRLPYAISKLGAEHYVRFFGELRRSVGSYFNVRFFGAYGPYEPERKITSRWLKAVNAGDREFTVRGDGSNLIDFMHVSDAVRGLLMLLNKAGESATLDFASKTPMTIKEVVSTMCEALKVEIAIRCEGRVPECIRFQTSDDFMERTFGFRPTMDLSDGIRDLQMALANYTYSQRMAVNLIK